MTSKRKILFIFGTRPEAIKMLPILKEMEKHKEAFDPKVVVTGQHREMLDQVLKIFNVKPDYDLAIMKENQTLSQIAIKSLDGLEDIIKKEKPNIILVLGDTTSAFAAGLAAFYHKISLAHVEAGLRTKNKYIPFPEEMNRKLITTLSDLHFAPTMMAVQSLLDEGVNKNNIYLTGNTVIDALSFVSKKQINLRSIGINLDKKKIVLVTAHRRESFGEPMREICRAIKSLAEKFPKKVKMIVPVHKNPKVRDTVNKMLKGIEEVVLIEPLEYLSFVHLMKASHLILTDSGGIQEEAPSLGKPVLVLRENTERPEAIIANTVKLVGTKAENIVKEAEKLLTQAEEYDKMARAINPYGDGRAAERIVDALLYYFSFTKARPEEFDVKKSLVEKIK